MLGKRRPSRLPAAACCADVTRFGQVVMLSDNHSSV